METAPTRILVVDDNELNRDMLSRRLVRQQYQVETAENGEQALEMLDEIEYELVLLDIMMPGLSGLEVLEIVREKRSKVDLPVIMATAKNDSSDIAAALRLGANDYVTKPLDFAVVLARLENQLALKAANDEIKRLAADLELRNEFIRHVFGRYMSDDIADSLLESPDNLELGGEKRVVTMLMSDLRGFASLSERLDADQVVTLLNTFLGAMTEVIYKYEGTIDEFIGDAIFVIFGAPRQRADDAERAIHCALGMQQRMEMVNESLREIDLPTVEMGIGVHTGEVVVGNVGSVARAKYGVVGRHVNTTGRIESFSVGRQILVSESTKRAIGTGLLAKQEFQIEGKGLDGPVTVFDVVGMADGPELSSSDDNTVLLSEPYRVQFVQLDGKHVSGNWQTATIERLSLTQAELCAENPVSIWTNLKIALGDNAPDTGGPELYAKVVDHHNDSKRTLRLHFTSVPASARAALTEAMRT